MPDLKEIYDRHADRYELLASREDFEGNILSALKRVRPLAGLDIVDSGAGTGRLACMLAPIARSILAIDVSQHMLDVAVAKLQQSGLDNWKVRVADHRALPLEANTADVVVCGWSLVYTAIWSPEPWQREVDRALAEMRRVLRPSGTIIVLETLGTGHETPHPPDDLRAYFAYLEAQGFASTWIRTDYLFESLEEAEASARFFFGESLAKEVRDKNWNILPECTGIWWLHLDPAS